MFPKYKDLRTSNCKEVRWVDLKSMAERKRQSGEIRADTTYGVIFHESRCGSTLASNMLAAVPGNRVLSEASVLSNAVIKDGQRKKGDGVLRMVLELMCAGSKRCFFKPSSSVGFRAMEAVVNALPDASFTFLYRNPVKKP